MTVVSAPSTAADCASRWVRSASKASAGSMPGPRRSENFARAAGWIVFEDSATEGASIPMMLSAGAFHSRSATGPRPARVTPSSTPASARKTSSG